MKLFTSIFVLVFAHVMAIADDPSDTRRQEIRRQEEKAAERRQEIRREEEKRQQARLDAQKKSKASSQVPELPKEDQGDFPQ